MRVTTWLLTSTLVLTVAGCSASKSTPSKSDSAASTASGKTMPNVTGQKLDKAEDAIQSAGGDPDKVKEIGGGRLGIVVKSNWTVCSQVPAAGAALPTAPQLTVERTCSSASTAASASAPPSSASSSSSASSARSAPAPLTVKTSKDLAALLKVGNNCAPSVGSFATKYAGREIEFDGSVRTQTPHADPNDIRHDILLAPGNYDVNSETGPSFQFQNVSDSDLHLSGAKSLKVGEELHLVAEVGDYDSDQCLFQLIPVATSVR